MTPEPIWILEDVVYAIHERQIALHGGAAGVRDVGRVEAAVARPRMIADYDEKDLEALAAAYAHGIAQGHPFVDGNKRTAFVVAMLFLELNGRRVEAGDAEKVEKTVALAAGELSEAEYAAWLRARSEAAR